MNSRINLLLQEVFIITDRMPNAHDAFLSNIRKYKERFFFEIQKY